MKLQSLVKYRYFHLALLCGWFLIGVYLRFTNLELKPPWSDEWATLVFSLGNSFQKVPLNEVITLDTLLSPLKIDFALTTQDTISNLLTESTHPPLYFTFNHWWLDLTGNNQGLVSIWYGRCFSALWGILAIPAMFILGYLSFRSLITAQIASALMAVSPLGVYLAQEARHYTLAILWLIASVGCLSIVIRKIAQLNSSVHWGLVFGWVVVNVLGVATHYFFALALVSETLVLLSWWWQDVIKEKNDWLSRNWQKIYTAIMATICGCLPWLWLWRSIPDNQLTSWVYQENSWLKFYEPVGRIILWLITKLALLPVEGVAEPIAIASGIIILTTLGWLTPALIRAYRQLKQQEQTKIAITILERFLLFAIALILIIAYTAGADLTLSSRFQFFYFPVWLLFIAGILGFLWQRSQRTALVLIMLGIFGSLSINHNLAFQKVERPDLVVPDTIAAYAELPVIIAIDSYTHGQTGELMSLGWQFQKLRQQQQISWQPQFLLARGIAPNLVDLINEIDYPFQLWLINFSPTPDLSQTSCVADENYQRRATGYKYRLYVCSL